MSVVIRLKRAGAKKRPFYKIVAADSRRQRDGRFLEILGHYDPIKQPFDLVLHKDKVERWLSRGAQPSDQVASLLRSAGMASWVNPSRSKKKTAEGGAKKKASAAKKAAPRAKPRKPSARKLKARTTRKAKRQAAGSGSQATAGASAGA